MQPLISIVTPSFNQAKYLADTIESVLGQNYPSLEYIVMDGGSTDGSPALIEGYAGSLAYWQSQKDGGQAAAINAGFAKARGEILAWLNSDDFYLPGTLKEVVRLLNPAQAQFLTGNCVTFDSQNHRASYSSVPDKLSSYDVTLWDFLVQPSTFWTRKAWEATGALDETLHFAFDWEWFIRAKKAGVEFIPTERCLSAYRIHDAHKSSQTGNQREQELALVYERHHGPAFSRAFLLASKKKEAILRSIKRAKKLGFAGNSPALLRLRFPGVFEGLSPTDIEHLVAMI